MFDRNYIYDHNDFMRKENHWCARRDIVIEMRKNKSTYKEIGQALGVSKERARGLLFSEAKRRVEKEGSSDPFLKNVLADSEARTNKRKAEQERQSAQRRAEESRERKRRLKLSKFYDRVDPQEVLSSIKDGLSLDGVAARFDVTVSQAKSLALSAIIQNEKLHDEPKPIGLASKKLEQLLAQA